MYKILFISSNLGGGGAERALTNIINHLDHTYFKPYLALYQKEGVFLNSIRPDIAIYELQPKKYGFLIRNLTRAYSLIKLCHELQPDLIMSIKWQVNVVTLLTLKIFANNTPVIVNEQGTPYDTTDKRRRLLWPIAKFSYLWSDHLIVLSKGLAEKLHNEIKFPKSKISVIHNPVDFSNFRNLPIKIPDLSNKSSCTLISAGRLVKTKNFPFLLNAFAKASKNHKLKLIILGEGPEKQNLLDLCHSLNIHANVHLMGFQEKIFTYFQKSDIFILPSLHEPFGNVIIEAMACGVPVIATDCPYGPREILENGVYGILVPVNNIEVLAQSILDLLYNFEKRQHYSQIGRQRAEEYSITNIILQYHSLFVSVIKQSKGIA